MILDTWWWQRQVNPSKNPKGALTPWNSRAKSRELACAFSSEAHTTADNAEIDPAPEQQEHRYKQFHWMKFNTQLETAFCIAYYLEWTKFGGKLHSSICYMPS